ncbi:MAG: tRNA-dihydrouridine synthase family protein [Candidatus Woesearchaeota archaeon]
MNFTLYAAPLEDTSDAAFRKMCYTHGADCTCTEMTRLKGLLQNNKSTFKKIELRDDTPTIIQLLVSNENDVETFLKTFVPQKGFKGFNLNMGCPSPNITNIGLGCAFMKRIEKTNKIIAVFRKYGYPISIKIRLGLNKFEKDKKAYLNIINNTNPDFFIVHARHGKETYDTPADFSVYEELVKTGKKIIANGDIHTKEQIQKLKAIGISGAMIGRAAVYNPAIFDVLKGNPVPSIQEIKEAYIHYAETFETPEKYKNNVLPRLGRSLETKERHNHVQG